MRKIPSSLTLFVAAFIPGLMPLPAQTHADSFSKEGLVKGDFNKMPGTTVLAHPELPLDASKNVIWCGTLQLAWNKAIDLVGGKLVFTKQPFAADLLNIEGFNESDLDPASYVAVADFERNHVEAKIRAALQKTFGGAASPELIPLVPSHPTPSDFLAYAYLYKNLAFTYPFAKNDPLTFEGTPVQNFGFMKDEDKDKIDPYAFHQVQINDYKSPDDFVITLQTKAPGDELILAKIVPDKTLEDTIENVLLRIDQNKDHVEYAHGRDFFAAPDLNFDLRGDFPELEGLALKPDPNLKVKNLQTSAVKQLIRFQLNEKGAILKSEAVMSFVGSAARTEPPPPPYQLIFDKPFLILMKQTASATPYFAMWVGNASLLIPAK